MPRSAIIALALLTLGLTLSIGCGPQASNVAAASSPVAYAVLSDQAQPLRDDFNRDAGQVRLVFLMDPRCPTCLRGLADIDRDLRKALPPTAKFKVYVIHEPVIGGKPKDVAGAAGLWRYPGARHYWSPTGNLGRQVTAALDLRRGEKPVFAWDVWMIYGPEAIWKDAPPTPRLLMHQLPELDGDPRRPHLDSKVFASEVRNMVARQSKTAGR